MKRIFITGWARVFALSLFKSIDPARLNNIQRNWLKESFAIGGKLVHLANTGAL